MTFEINLTYVESGSTCIQARITQSHSGQFYFTGNPGVMQILTINFHVNWGKYVILAINYEEKVFCDTAPK